MTDISHWVLLSKLVGYLCQNAPHIRLSIVPIEISTPALMAEGEIILILVFCFN